MIMKFTSIGRSSLFAMALSLWFTVAATGQPASSPAAVGNDSSPQFDDVVLADKPVAFWRFEATDGSLANHVDPISSKPPTFVGKASESVKFDQAGPRPGEFPDFRKDNLAARFGAKGSAIHIPDQPGKESPLKFRKGDSITIEAWVNPDNVRDQEQIYIIGKGRTAGSGAKAANQNWSLRLRGVEGGAGVSFLFRNEKNRSEKDSDSFRDWHRWTSEGLISAGTGWHHVAITYTYGKGDSIRGYIDGQPVLGYWDMGGQTDDGPVVDDDDIVIGTSMGNNPSSTFKGLLDEIAVYRTALKAEQIAERYRYAGTDRNAVERVAVDEKNLPTDKVLVEFVEGVPDRATWAFTPNPPSDQFEVDSFALTGYPKKYNSKAIVVDRTNPFVLRLGSRVSLEAGEYQFVLRSLNSARLFVAGKEIAQTRFVNPNASGHEPVPKLPESTIVGILPITPGHQEKIATVKLEKGEHVIVLEAMVGGKRVRQEVGELVVAIAAKGQPFRVLAPSRARSADYVEGDLFVQDPWNRFKQNAETKIAAMNVERRSKAGAKEAEYWAKRHEQAREILKNKVVDVATPQAAYAANNQVDHFINARLAEVGAKAGQLVDDRTFLRRVYLDTVGVIPTPQEAAAFLADQRTDKRAKLIDALLTDPRWADHWVSYWQDVLAENPSMLKPTLNNTGPFRWWIYESLVDNKSMDRFATELVMMEGSAYTGTPGGFAMASQNDLPMAAKAHVIGKAFLGIEMKCARCHDAPQHPFEQKDLFNLAAMLDRRPLKVPASSVVKATPEEAKRMLITMSLKAGETISPAWPFEEFAPSKPVDGAVRDPNDSRDVFAATLTSPHNSRFTQVLANRIWKRLMGFGIVDPVDDWDQGRPSHPQLLAWLGHELAMNNYDMKHLARVILNSQAYQREVGPTPTVTPKAADRLFASQSRRRMSAEQIVDSLFVAAGKQLRSEMLSFDQDGRRPAAEMINFGVPRRAWEFTSMSNERDRPALALPIAQSIVDVLVSFGWRETRPDSITDREDAPTVIQPLMLANGLVASSRIARLSDDGAMTELAMRELSLEDLIKQTYERLLTREPTKDEVKLFDELLRDGFYQRRVQGAKIVMPKAFRSTVSWANHLNDEATRVKLDMEAAAREGDPPTQRLTEDWRQRMEDMIWAVMNSPEFVFVP